MTSSSSALVVHVLHQVFVQLQVQIILEAGAILPKHDRKLLAETGTTVASCGLAPKRDGQSIPQVSAADPACCQRD